MKQSAGILVFSRVANGVEVLLVHPAGPIWAHRDFWSIPKGELDDSEDHLAAANREFLEEVGLEVPSGELITLGTAKASNKMNFIWAVEGDVDLAKFSCNTFTMEWPPRSGQLQKFPENDRAEWFPLVKAKQKIFKSQIVFLDRLAKQLQLRVPESPTQQALL